MPNYRAGDLSLSITGASDKAIASIDKVIDRLSSLQDSLNKMDFTKLSSIDVGTSKGSSSKGGCGRKSQDKHITEQTYQINKQGESYQSLNKTIDKTSDGISKVTSYFNAQGVEIKNITEEIDKFGNKVKEIRDLQAKEAPAAKPDIIKEQTYNIDEQGNSYLELEKIIDRSGDKLKTVTTYFDEQGEEVKRLTEEIDKYGNKIKSIQTLKAPVVEQEEPKPTLRTETSYSIDSEGKKYLSFKKTVDSAGESVKTVNQYFDQQGKEIKKVTVEVDKYGNKITTVSENMAKVSKKGFGFFDIFNLSNIGKIVAKIGAVFLTARKLAQITSKIVQYGTDYTETLNLWQVAMRDNLDMAEEFVDKMNKAYGISRKTLMNAQAIFKNMLSSLGNISDQAAYAISEAVTQMAVDYSSLYNVQVEDAITKFEAALAGQVRPIRSTSGYDITENTIYQLYQQLGGTKTMRQLNRTEKQLLSIYAIFQQMGKSGALGDMAKTMDSFANQSRMAKENWTELATWTGITIQQALQLSGIMEKINAVLIFLTETMKALAGNLGYVDPDFASAWSDNINAANEAQEKLNGSLLDFDKFRALDESDDTQSAFGIDQTVLDAITNYSSQLDTVMNKARELAKEWLVSSVLFYIDEATGELKANEEKINDLKIGLKVLGGILLTIFGISTIGSIVKVGKTIYGIFKTGWGAIKIFGGTFFDVFKGLIKFIFSKYGVAIAGVAVGVYEIIDGIRDIIDSVKEAGVFTTDSLKGLAKLLIGIVVIGAAISLLFGSWIPLAIAGIVAGVAAIVFGVTGLIKNFGEDIGNWFKKLGASIVNFFIYALNGLIEMVNIFIDAINYLIANDGIKAIVGLFGGEWNGIPHIKTVALRSGGWGIFSGEKGFYADGGLPDRGTMFYAGEAGAEIVYNSGSQSGVANIQQIQQAMYNALVAYGNTHAGTDSPIEVYLDGEKVYQNTTSHAKRRGNVWSKV